MEIDTNTLEALRFLLNDLPNRKMEVCGFKNTYQLAARLRRLNDIELEKISTLRWFTITTIVDGENYTFCFQAQKPSLAVEMVSDMVKRQYSEMYGVPLGDPDEDHSGWIVSMVITADKPQRTGEY